MTKEYLLSNEDIMKVASQYDAADIPFEPFLDAAIKHFKIGKVGGQVIELIVRWLNNELEKAVDKMRIEKEPKWWQKILMYLIPKYNG